MSHNISGAASTRRASLRREIIAILAFKLLALIALRFLFFDDRPHITPVTIEEHLFAPANGGDGS